MYLFDNELFAIECMAKYAMEGLVVNSRNGQFAHCPTPKPKGQKCKLPGDWGYYLTHGDHQHQGLLQSNDVGRRCFWVGHTKRWLNTYPPNYFELCDIFDEYVKGAHSGNLGVPRRLGIPNSEETKKRMSEAKSGGNCYLVGRTGASHHTSKAVIIIKPDGTKLHFGSISEAARKIGMDDGYLCRCINLGKQTKWGRYKDWQFFYAE
jgi:hypothetical protein